MVWRVLIGIGHSPPTCNREESSELVPCAVSVSIVVNLQKHLLDHRHRKGRLHLLDDLRMGLVQLQEQTFGELLHVQRVVVRRARKKLLFQERQCVGGKGGDEVAHGSEQPRSTVLQAGGGVDHQLRAEGLLGFDDGLVDGGEQELGRPFGPPLGVPAVLVDDAHRDVQTVLARLG